MNDSDLLVPCVFLFRSDIEALGDYGTPARQAVVAALFKADASRTVSSRILEGDLLLSLFAERIVSYQYDPTKRRSSVTKAFDGDLAKQLIWEVADGLLAQDNTLDSSSFLKGLLRHSVFCLSMPSVSNALWRAVDKDLQRSAAYVGAATLDAGNPLQVALFSRSLMDNLYVSGGKLILRAVKGAHEPSAEEWAEAYGCDVALDYTEGGPPALCPVGPSERGQEATDRLRQKSKLGPRERVLEGLSRSSPGGNQLIQLTTPLEMPTAVTIGQKLISYCLNPDHPDGMHKARVFKAALGITVADSEFLAKQLIDGLASTDVSDLRMSNHGELAYYTDISVLGKNGEACLVHAAWRVYGDLPIRLITAYVIEGTPSTEQVPDPPRIISPDIVGDDKWATLEQVARERAERSAHLTIPTPMIISEGWEGEGKTEVVPDGACGGAYIVVKDGAKGFAGWLRRNNRGQKYSARYQSVTANLGDQSYERAVAFAVAYNQVLAANGVKAEIHKYYD